MVESLSSYRSGKASSKIFHNVIHMLNLNRSLKKQYLQYVIEITGSLFETWVGKESARLHVRPNLTRVRGSTIFKYKEWNHNK